MKTQKLRGAEVPVLFMRLRSGELLRVEGEVRGDPQAATFWARLIARISDNTCIPFLGPRINRGILPRPETIAMEVATSNGYRLADKDNLARVAQFEAFEDPVAFRATYLDILKQSLCRTFGRPAEAADRKALRKMSLTRLVEAIGWESMVGRVEELRIYEQLAALELPLYITSSVDSFLFEALKHRMGANAVNARRIGPRWQKTTAGAPSHSLLDPEPSNTTPYVLHLNGFDDRDRAITAGAHGLLRRRHDDRLRPAGAGPGRHPALERAHPPRRQQLDVPRLPPAGLGVPRRTAGTAATNRAGGHAGRSCTWACSSSRQRAPAA